MDYKAGCLICGEELAYSSELIRAECVICRDVLDTNVKCTTGHFVCDTCHSVSANELIEQYCATSESTNPVTLATTLMKSPRVKMNGPEHHFLVPAVLLATYYNQRKSDSSEKVRTIGLARRRAEDVKGGVCGYSGSCGAAIGTGIFMSLITDATPLSKEEWRLSNLMTAESLRVIALRGGPRCCKRDTYLAISSAADFVRREFNVSLDTGGPIVCDFSSLNKECLKQECPFYNTVQE